MYLVNGNKKFGTLEFFQVVTKRYEEEEDNLTNDVTSRDDG